MLTLTESAQAAVKKFIDSSDSDRRSAFDGDRRRLSKHYY